MHSNVLAHHRKQKLVQETIVTNLLGTAGTLIIMLLILMVLLIEIHFIEQ
jgi:hypothetical protein